MDNAIIWLIRLLAAHLVTDFVLQPKSWVDARSAKHYEAKQFWFHILLTTFVAAWFTCFDSWWVPLIILVTHGLIDLWKSYAKDTVLNFAIDQFLHVSVIVIIWGVKFPDVISFKQIAQTCLVDRNIWIVGISVLFLTTPVGILIGMLTKRFRNQIRNQSRHSLQNAGTWVGILERLIIFFLVLIGQYEAIGLLVAAKSIIRLKEGEQKMSEYVLIGTLISISVALLIGYIVSKSM